MADVGQPAAGSRPRVNSGRWQRQLQLLRQERQCTMDGVPAALPSGPDPLEVAQARTDELLWFAAAARDRTRRFQVDAALHQLTQGQYGLCLECEDPIPPARLQACPCAVRCRPCQERREERAKATGRSRRF